ncbi:Aste57867_2300 [Aphanomyces stellatus]|uniref:Aste57867_2300 protein n=1 Tax=Aphanomyces stellatus TaxID=120398 RepID=A0A485K8C4_9STRA|nr:hypothetical protein As57867_002295 [Aphanomyces stellatus]VFT79503.1 Aste57867_2300 [Aphanomyces stellatus]
MVIGARATLAAGAKNASHFNPPYVLWLAPLSLFAGFFAGPPAPPQVATLRTTPAAREPNPVAAAYSEMFRSAQAAIIL